MSSALRTVTTSATATATTTAAVFTALARLDCTVAELCLLILLGLLSFSGSDVGTRQDLLVTRRALCLAVTAGAVAPPLTRRTGFTRFTWFTRFIAP